MTSEPTAEIVGELQVLPEAWAELYDEGRESLLSHCCETLATSTYRQAGSLPVVAHRVEFRRTQLVLLLWLTVRLPGPPAPIRVVNDGMREVRQ